jgi:transcriptional regulator of arginine metabolism
MSNTAARRRAIRRIIAHQPVASQLALVEQLDEAGFDVTQATVSRDLKELGAIKARDDHGNSVYALPAPGAAVDETIVAQALRRVLVEFAETIVPTGNLVIITTPPGAAQVVAGAIDRGGIEGVLGTVAGDDTLLVVVADSIGGWRIAKQLEQLGAGP